MCIRDSYNAVSKALGLGRGLAEIEKKYVDHWQNDWNMDLSVILDVYKRQHLLSALPVTSFGYFSVHHHIFTIPLFLEKNSPFYSAYLSFFSTTTVSYTHRDVYKRQR